MPLRMRFSPRNKTAKHKSDSKSERNSYNKDSNATYAYNRPLVKPLPSGTSLSRDVVDIIYSMKKTIEDQEYEIEFVKSIFEPKTLPSNQATFFDFVFNDEWVRLPMSDETFKMHIKNLYDPNYFIKDYKYLVKKFKINAKKLRASVIQPKNTALGTYFELIIRPIYSRIIVINNILQKIEDYRKSHPNVSKYPQEVASRLLEASHERYYTPPNNPIYVLKMYIKDLNKQLFTLRHKVFRDPTLYGYKIMLNNSIIKELNKRLDKLNTYLVEPDPSIVDQANAKFYIRILGNSSKSRTKSRSNSSRQESKVKTLKRAKSF
jgi:hypothetical protein